MTNRPNVPEEYEERSGEVGNYDEDKKPFFKPNPEEENENVESTKNDLEANQEQKNERRSISIESKYGSAVLENAESTTYPADCYSLMSLHGPGSRHFWFGLMVFMVQITFLVLMVLGVVQRNWNTSNVDDNPKDSFWAAILATDASPLVRGAQFLSLVTYVIFADASMADMILAVHTFPRFSRANSRDRVWCMVLSCVLRFVQGFFAMIVAIFLVFISNNAIEVILNFTALNYISTLDDVAFELSKSGKYGPALENEMKRIEELPLPPCMFRKRKSIRYLFTIVPLAIIMLGAFGLVVFYQRHYLDWDTQVLRIQFDDIGLRELQDYNGCYRKKTGGTDSWKRHIYESFEYNQKHATFAFCIKKHQWYLYDDEELLDDVDPCLVGNKMIIQSSESDAFDISSIFSEDWFTFSGTPSSLYFFGGAHNNESKLHCEEFLGNGICDDFFNTADYKYDGGDCCAATCTHPLCSLGGLKDAFNSTNTTGDGYSNCKDPDMMPLTISLDGFVNSRNSAKLSEKEKDIIELYYPEFWTEAPIDTFLSIYCDNINVLRYYINESMVNQNVTMMISNRANNCEIYIENTANSKSDYSNSPIWYVNYTVYHGESMMDPTTKIIQGNSYDASNASFSFMPSCYFDKLSNHINIESIYESNEPSSKAISWLMEDKSGSTKCVQESFLRRYALVVMSFAAPIAESSGNKRSLWIRQELECYWPNIQCVGRSGSSTMDYFNMEFSNNGIAGYIATEIGLLENLEKYDVSQNALTGSIPSEIGLLDSLTNINVGVNSLTGSIPTEIGMLSNTVALDINNNRLTGSIPNEIANLSNLQVLVTDDNRLTGSIPSGIGSMTLLELLSIGNNVFTGSIPSEIGLLTSLELLSIGNNSFTGSIPSEIGLLTSMTNIILYSNYFAGSIPTEIGLLTALTYLELLSNNLTGSIPTEIGLLTALSYLGLSRNSLSGSIPTEIGLLTALTHLDLSSNNLTGSIPTEIVFLSDLSNLILFGEGLTGSIPSEIGMLTSLNTIAIGGNSITGTIPTEIGGLLALKLLVTDSKSLPKDFVPPSLETMVEIVEPCILCGGIGSIELIDLGNDNDNAECSGISTFLKDVGRITIEQCALLQRKCILCNDLSALEPFP